MGEAPRTDPPNSSKNFYLEDDDDGNEVFEPEGEEKMNSKHYK